MYIYVCIYMYIQGWARHFILPVRLRQCATAATGSAPAPLRHIFFHLKLRPRTSAPLRYRLYICQCATDAPPIKKKILEDDQHTDDRLRRHKLLWHK